MKQMVLEGFAAAGCILPELMYFRRGGRCARAGAFQTELNGCIFDVTIAAKFNLCEPVHTRRM